MKIILETAESDRASICMDLKHDEQRLADMLEAFERLLRAAGYYFSGHLEVVDDG